MRWLGGVNVGVISHELGVTRSAITGKASRMGLGEHPFRTKLRKHQVNRRKTPEQRRIRIKQKFPYRDVIPVETRPALPEPEFLGLSLIELDEHQCRYPQGEGPFLFCGQPAQEDSSYCSYHHRICYFPVTPMRRRV